MVAIGIDRYRHWRALSNAASDAVGAATTLRQLGFEQVVPPLLDEQATHDAIEALVTDELDRLQPNDSLIIFFAGHGGARTQQVGERVVRTTYLIPVDGTAESSRVRSWLDLDPWLRRISKLPPRHILVILDACFSGGVLSSVVKWGRDNGALRSLPFAAANARPSRLVIASTLGDERAMDGGPYPGHSLFTGCLLEGLTGGIVPVTVRDGRPLIIGSDLGHYVRRRVAMYDGRPGWEQTPDLGSFDYDERGEMLIPVLIGDALHATTPTMARGSVEQIVAPPTTAPLVATDPALAGDTIGDGVTVGAAGSFAKVAATAIDAAAGDTLSEGGVEGRAGDAGNFEAAASDALADDAVSEGITKGAVTDAAKVEAAAIDAAAGDTISDGVARSAAREIANVEAAAIDAFTAGAAAIEAAALAAMPTPRHPRATSTSPAVEPVASGDRRRRPVTVTITVAVTVAAIVALLWRNAGESTSTSPSLADDVHGAAPASPPDFGAGATSQPRVADSPTAPLPAAPPAMTPPSSTSPGSSSPSPAGASAPQPAAPAAPAGTSPGVSPAAIEPRGDTAPAASPGKPPSAMTVRRSGSAAGPPAVAPPRVASPSAPSQATQICPTMIKSPKGAEVSWNGKVETVPVELRLPCNVEVTLSFRQAQHVNGIRKITAKPGGTPINVRLPRGFLVHFTSTPPGAMVVWQGASSRWPNSRPDEQLGVTPVTATLPTSETSTVTFHLPGYQVLTQSVTPLDDAAQVEVTLVPAAPRSQ